MGATVSMKKDLVDSIVELWKIVAKTYEM